MFGESITKHVMLLIISISTYNVMNIFSLCFSGIIPVLLIEDIPHYTVIAYKGYIKTYLLTTLTLVLT